MIYPRFTPTKNRVTTERNKMKTNNENESTKRIADAIGAWVRKDGSMSKLAGELGLTEAGLNLRMSGLKEWTWDEVVKLSRVIGCSLNEF